MPDREKTDCLGVISALDCIQFNYKKAVNNNGEVVDPANGDKRIHFGFKAQQLADIYPVDQYAVVNRDQAGFLSVNYGMLIPVLASALKLLRGKFGELRDKLSTLEQRWESTDEEMAERCESLEKRVQQLEEIIRKSPELNKYL